MKHDTYEITTDGKLVYLWKIDENHNRELVVSTKVDKQGYYLFDMIPEFHYETITGRVFYQKETFLEKIIAYLKRLWTRLCNTLIAS